MSEGYGKDARLYKWLFSPKRKLKHSCPSHRWWNSDETITWTHCSQEFWISNLKSIDGDVRCSIHWSFMAWFISKHGTPFSLVLCGPIVWCRLHSESISQHHCRIHYPGFHLECWECKLRHPHLMVVKPSNCGPIHVLQAHHEGSVPRPCQPWTSKSTNHYIKWGCCINCNIFFATSYIIMMRCSILNYLWSIGVLNLPFKFNT